MDGLCVEHGSNGVILPDPEHDGKRFGYTGLSHESAEGKVSFDDMSECDNSICIELNASPGIQLLQCLLEGAPSPVGTVAGNGVKGVRHRQNPRQERDLLFHQSIRVAPPIPPFVMMTDNGPFS